MEKLVDLIETILDIYPENEVKISVYRDGRGWHRIVVADNFSEIANVFEFLIDKAVSEAFEQLQSYVDEAQS